MASVTKAQLEAQLEELRKEVDEVVSVNVALRYQKEKLTAQLKDAQERLFYYRGHALVYMPEVLGKEFASEGVEG